jgi:hypothetical protein
MVMNAIRDRSPENDSSLTSSKASSELITANREGYPLVPEKPGGLNRSMQHWLEVYSPGFKAQSLSRALIEAQSYLVEIGLRVDGQVGLLGEVLS